MKRFLPFIFSILMTSLSFGMVTWNGAGMDNFWNNPDNWDTGAVPGPTDDAIIPDGFTVEMDLPGTDVSSITMLGTSSLTMLSGTLIFSTTFDMSANATLNWFGIITGGGVLTNNGTINLGNSNGILGSNVGGGTMIENNGVINLNDVGDLNVQTDCVVNNNLGATININSNASGITRSGSVPHVLNNAGDVIINTPNQTDQVNINVQVLSSNGKIEVISGILNLDSDSLGSVYTDGSFDTAVGARINVMDEIEISGTIRGANQGTLNLPDAITIPTTATLNITGAGIIKFNPSLFGGGTLTNQSVLTQEAFPTTILDGTTLINENLIEFTAAGDILIGTGSTLNNTATGIIDFKGDTGNIQSSGASPNTLLNSGIIRTSFTGNGSDTAQISAELNNTGVMEVNNGTLLLFNNNIQLNGGTYTIATDGIFEWANIVTIAGSMSGNIAGNGILKWNGKVNVPVAASLDFGGSQTIDWFNGNIDGGGVLTNNNILNIGSASNAFILGGTTLNNRDTINFNSNDDLLIETNGVLNNEMMGTINFLADGASIGVNGSAPRLFENFGTIVVDLPNADDDVSILCEFNNNNATIDIQRGIFNLNNNTKDAQNLLDGNYMISLDGAFDWDGNVTLSGILTGDIQGLVNWRGVVWVNASTSATFFFSGQEQIEWVSGALDGGGLLLNTNEIDIVSNGNVPIRGATTLNNEGDINLTTFGDLALTMNSTLNNLVPGEIEMQVPAGNIIASGVGPQFFNNFGELTADSGGVNFISVETTNSGVIDIKSGELEINSTSTFLNDTTGIIEGEGIFDLPSPSNFTNNGTIAPGSSPGILTIIGDYSSTSSSILDIEIDGLNQGTEFDFIPITGDDVIFEGTVNVTLDFDADVNDEFIISTTTGNIIICGLQSPTMATFGGFNYEFDVICRNDNEVVLTVISETLSTDNFELNDSSFNIYPNPADDFIIIENESLIGIEDMLIYDIQGRLVLHLENYVRDDRIDIDLSQLNSGNYFLKIQTELGSVVKQVIRK